MEAEVRAAVEGLRARIEKEREMISALDESLTQEPAREWLKQATNHVDDARGILLGVEESLTPWVLIRGSNEFLGLAAQHRQKVEEARRKYGPDVTLVG